MSEDIKREQAYWSTDVAKNLNVGESTLRKYCLALENENYQFIRGSNNSRAFTDKDIIVLRRFKHLVHQERITLKEAATIVINEFGTTDRTTGVTEEQIDKRIYENDYITREQGNEILERLEKQEQFNKSLLEQLEKQQKYIEESIIKRDQQLLESIREVQETKKLIAAAAETVEKENEQKNNKKWWQKIFK
ncbi:DUF3967 domain-containing protein [Metabacillus niabensis]|uniref:DUF3967 domain-containing protein n=1 Tax=Metabacillus niabensis TaxID=324854 RepID=UPI00399FD655